jgi:hypothetical protein
MATPTFPTMQDAFEQRLVLRRGASALYALRDRPQLLPPHAVRRVDEVVAAVCVVLALRGGGGDGGAPPTSRFAAYTALIDTLDDYAARVEAEADAAGLPPALPLFQTLLALGAALGRDATEAARRLPPLWVSGGLALMAADAAARLRAAQPAVAVLDEAARAAPAIDLDNDALGGGSTSLQLLVMSGLLAALVVALGLAAAAPPGDAGETSLNAALAQAVTQLTRGMAEAHGMAA